MVSSNFVVENIFLFNPNTTCQQLTNAIQRSLKKAEALAIVATLVDLDAINKETLENYLWTLSDIVHEAKTLYEQTIDLI